MIVTWALVLLTTFSQLQGAMTTVVLGYRSADACEMAGKAWATQRDRTYKCVPGPER